MRALARTLIATVLLASLPLIGGPAAAQQSPIPERRFILSENLDLPGGDLASIFDTTLDACERACLADSRCTAFTFNSRNGSCFPKAGTGASVPFAGAYSGLVALAETKALASIRPVFRPRVLATSTSPAAGQWMSCCSLPPMPKRMVIPKRQATLSDRR